MENITSLGNDRLTEQFYETFQNKIKGHYQLEKKNRDKRHIKNWRPLRLLHVDTKMLSKTLALKRRKILPSIILHQQTAYVKNRKIDERT